MKTKKSKKTTANKPTTKKNTTPRKAPAITKKATPAKKQVTKQAPSTKKAPTAPKKSTGKSTTASKNSVTKAVSTKSTKAKQPSMQSKIEKADELRKKTNKSINSMNNIVKNWQEKLKGASQTERKQIDKVYQAQFDKADKKEAQAYAEYYDFIHENFSTEQIMSANPYGSFTSKAFINRLSKTTSKPVQPVKNTVTNKSVKGKTI